VPFDWCNPGQTVDKVYVVAMLGRTKYIANQVNVEECFFLAWSDRQKGRRKGCATCAAAQGAIERGGRQNGWSEKNIISQGQNVPPWASEGAQFKHVAQGAKMPSYSPDRQIR
jgi:hypothetical protein